MMRGIAAALSLAATPLWALDCTLTRDGCVADCQTIAVSFNIDAAQFAQPQDPNDPPRRQMTTVQMDRAVFVAEAILMPGGARGFYEDAGALGSRLMIVQTNGNTRMALQPSGQIWVGQCREGP